MAHLGGLSGGGTAITQNVMPDAGNSSTANIAIGGNFTGAWKSTLGVAALQYTFAASQPCIVYVQQSTDGINVDDERLFYHNPLGSVGNANQCVLALGALWRVRVVNIGAGIATGVRLNSVLCPIAPPDPPGLNPYGAKKVATYGQWSHYGDEQRMSPHGFLDVNQPYRLVGTMIGTVAEGIDANFWAATGTGALGESHTITAGGVVTLVTGTNAAAYSQLQTVRKARYVNLNSHRAYGRVLIPTVVVAGSTRYWGAFTSAGGPPPAVVDGYVFELDAAGTLSLKCYTAGVATASIASGSFNGDVNQYVVDTNSHAYEIVWTVSKVRFIVDGELLHTFNATTVPLVGTQHLNWTALARGTGTSASMQIWSGSISRLGRDATGPKWSYDTATAGKALKIGPGRLHRAVIDTGNNAATIAMYDSPTAAANQIAGLSLVANSSPVSIAYDLDFYNGLWLVTTGASVTTTVVYE